MSLAQKQGHSFRSNQDKVLLSMTTVLRMLLMGAAVVAVGWRLTTGLGLFAAAFSAIPGVLLGEYVARTRLRWLAISLGTLFAFWLIMYTASCLVYWSWPSQILGGMTALSLAEALRWGGGCALFIGYLRMLSLRHPSFALLELLFPLIAAAGTFAAHRDGNLHRPQQLVDWAIEEGRDPIWLFSMIGLGAAMFLAVGLLKVRKKLQLLGGFVLIALLFVLYFSVFSRIHFPTIQKVMAKSKSKQSSGKQKKNMSFKAPPPKSKTNPVAVVIFRSNFRMPNGKYSDKVPGGIYYFRQQVLSHFNGVRLLRTSRTDLDREQAQKFPAEGNTIKIQPSTANDPKVQIQPRPVPRKKLTVVRKTKQAKTLKPAPKLKRKRKRRRRSRRRRRGREKKQLKKTVKKPSTSELLERALKLLRNIKKKKIDQKHYREYYVKTVVSLLREHRNPFGLIFATRFRGLPNPNPRLFLRSYEVESLVWDRKASVRHPVGNPRWSADQWKHYTQGPKESRYKKLLKNILARYLPADKKHPPLLKAHAIKHWMETTLYYSMKNRNASTQKDPVGTFLFSSKVGYCVHFAHAAVFLFRLAGVPARMAEGYAIPERHRGSGTALLVRDTEAHAWPEVYVRGVGWTHFDIYPRNNLDRQTQSPDPNLRQLLARLTRKQKPILKKKLKKIKQRKEEKRNVKVTAGWRIPWSIPLFLLLFTLFGLKFWRRWSYRFVSGPEQISGFFLSLEDRLAEFGIRREIGESLEAFALRMQPKLPSLRSVLDILVGIRLGSRLVEPKKAGQSIKEVEREFSKTHAWYWRILRFFDPVTWTFPIWIRWQVQPPEAWLLWQDRWMRLRSRLTRKSQKETGEGEEV